MSLPWRENWNSFGELKHEGPELRKWFFEEYLGCDDTMYALITSGPLTTKAFIECLSNEKAQFDARWPVRVRIAAVNVEPIFCPKRAEDAKPMKRVYQYMVPWDELDDGWDTERENVQQLKREVEEAFQTLVSDQRSYFAQKELDYSNPNSKKFWKLLKELAVSRLRKRRKSARRRFDMLLSGPNGRWIDRRLRACTGEIAFPNTDGAKTRSGRTKLKLHEIEVLKVMCKTFGFCWGFHPMRPERSVFGYTAYAGKDVVQQMIEERLVEARGALMGLGPWTMDDPTLLELMGPKTELSIQYPPGKRTNEEKHLEGSQVLRWIPEQIPLCLFGDGSDRGNLGDLIAGRILVLYHAHLEGLI